MRTHGRFPCILLALCVTAGLLAGCGRTSTTTVPTEPATEAEATTTAPAEPATEAEATTIAPAEPATEAEATTIAPAEPVTQTEATTMPAAPTETGAPAATQPAADLNRMVELRITILDKDGNPAPNLCVNLEYLSGEEGSYMPGDALTKSTGTVLRSAHPNAAYKVLVTDRKQLDYEGLTQRNQMEFPIEVVDGGETEFSFTWEHPLPRELDLATQGMVALTFYDAGGKPVQDLWVSMSSADDKEPEPRQIILGITDEDGRVYWTQPEEGVFEGAAIFFNGEREESSWSDTFTLETVSGKSNYVFAWEAKE